MAHPATAIAARPAGLLNITRSLLSRARPAAVVVASSSSLAGRQLPHTAAGWGCWRMAAATSARRSLAAGAVVMASGTEGSSDDDVVEVELKVDGMVCDGCSSRVQETLEKMPGVKKVHVDLEKGIAAVHVEAGSQIDAFNALPALVEAVTGLGFEAAPNL